MELRLHRSIPGSSKVVKAWLCPNAAAINSAPESLSLHPKPGNAHGEHTDHGELADEDVPTFQP